MIMFKKHLCRHGVNTEPFYCWSFQCGVRAEEIISSLIEPRFHVTIRSLSRLHYIINMCRVIIKNAPRGDINTCPIVDTYSTHRLEIRSSCSVFGSRLILLEQGLSAMPSNQASGCNNNLSPASFHLIGFTS